MIYNILDIGRSGLKSMQNKMDQTSSDIANVNTHGYKRKNISFQELIVNEIRESEVMINAGNNLGISCGSKSDVGKVDFIQGNLSPSAGEFNMGIEGEGFFGIRDENQNLLLTRNGNFHLNEDMTITNDKGEFLEMELEIPMEEWGNKKVLISKDGSITNEDSEILGRIPLFRPNSKDTLISLGEMKYTFLDGEVLSSIDNEEGFGEINQYCLEESNVNLSQSMVDLITTQRAYSANSKVIQTVDDIINIINNIKQ